MANQFRTRPVPLGPITPSPTKFSRRDPVRIRAALGQRKAPSGRGGATQVAPPVQAAGRATTSNNLDQAKLLNLEPRMLTRRYRSYYPIGPDAR